MGQLPAEVPRAEKTLPVTCLPVQRRREAAILAARAFVDSPAYTYILRCDSNFRLEALVWLFERNILLVQEATRARRDGCVVDATNCVQVAGPSKRIVCFFVLCPLGAPVSFCQKVSAGFLLFPFLFGFAAFFRYIKIYRV